MLDDNDNAVVNAVYDTAVAADAVFIIALTVFDPSTHLVCTLQPQSLDRKNNQERPRQTSTHGHLWFEAILGMVLARGV